MKTQMRFQKIFMLVSLIIAALCVVFALIFCSGTLYQMQMEDIFDKSIEAETGGVEYVTGAKDLFWTSQGISNTVLILGIVLIVVMALNYLMGTAKRRKYYITNYVSIGITIAYELAVAIVILVLVSKCQAILQSINLKEAEMIYNSIFPDSWSYSDWSFGVGYAVGAILIVNAVVFALNLVWKIMLMRGEKKLLESGLVKEVA